MKINTSLGFIQETLVKAFTKQSAQKWETENSEACNTVLDLTPREYLAMVCKSICWSPFWPYC